MKVLARRFVLGGDGVVPGCADGEDGFQVRVYMLKPSSI